MLVLFFAIGCNAATTVAPQTPANLSPVSAATVVFEKNKDNGCPDPTNPLGWYDNGTNDGHGSRCVNNVWVKYTPTPANTPTSAGVSQKWVASADINEEKIIWSPTADKPYKITVKGLPALASMNGDDRYLILQGNLVAQALYDWGLRGKITPVHYEWVGLDVIQWSCHQSQPVYACTNFIHEGTEFTVYLSRGYLEPSPFDNSEDLYNSMIQGETYRLIMLKVPGKLSTSIDGPNSLWWTEWGNKKSAYRFVTPQ